MKKFVILTDSCSDLPLELREKYDIDYIPMHFSCEGKEYIADLDYKEISVKDFYNLMRDGKRVITAQTTAPEYTEKFTKIVEDGFDILSISCSSALSASVKASYVARDSVLEAHPDAKIICIDSLMSCAGLAAICIKASKLRGEGESIEECAAWVEENKLKFNQEASVDKLTYLKQAGRVSAASAFFGGIFNVKPIIISDCMGRNAAIEKVKGRRVSMARIAERVADAYYESDIPLFISHADVPEEAELLREMVFDKLRERGINPESLETYTTHIGPIVGASVGPGTIAAYFYGKAVTFDAEAK